MPAVLVTLAVVPALAGCGDSEPTLLEKSDFENVVKEYQGWGSSRVEGGTWCQELTPTLGMGGPYSSMQIGDDRTTFVSAGIVRDGPYDPAEALIDEIRAAAARCTQYAKENPELSIEPLTGLGDGVMGWRTGGGVHYSEGGDAWGEWAVVQLDRTRLLAVGFETTDDEAPVDINELLALAREGWKRFG